ncbi:toxin [Mycobacterium phage Che9c]|uniref:HicA-like toxin n=1 Tax=Mycobacterium phage Che9c TaxID=2907832 RepID=Q854W6_9CAUD|nr:toxin [Mycobacterium phage Che9c]AAN12592.1 hypothetical protein PBI_CHE9C_31 [Mycobacterium phage Che9c]
MTRHLRCLAVKLRLMKSRDVNRRIESLGGIETRQRGSHRRYAVVYTDKSGNERTAFTTVQQHKGQEIPLGTLRAIQRDLEPAFGEGWLLG